MKHLITIAVALFSLYTITAWRGHFVDRFYLEGDQVHTAHKLDFYQVPNAAYMFLRGGPLGGMFEETDPQYPPGNYNMPNPYHPVFTLAVGGMLQQLPLEYAYSVWFLINTILWGKTAHYIFVRFRKNRHLPVAMLMFLGAHTYYLNLRNGQYHILLVVLITFLLSEFIREHGSKIKENVLFSCSLLVKPIALLYLPALLQARKGKSILVGGSVFAVLTIVFVFLSYGMHRDVGLYYIVNLISRMGMPILGPPQAFSLDALLRSWNIPFYETTVVKVVVAIALVMYNPVKRHTVFLALFLWSSYFLLFYDFVYEYHFLLLAPFFALGVLTEKVFRTNLALIAMTTYLLPSPYFLLRLHNVDIAGNSVTLTGWSIMVLWRIAPLIVLCVLILNNQARTSEKIKQALNTFLRTSY